MAADLDGDFAHLAESLQQLIGLLEEGGDRFWVGAFRRGLIQVEEHRLSGATFVLGCYGGVDTFSDFVLAPDLEAREPLSYRNLNARLTELRTRTFEAANAIAARRNW